MLLVTRMSAPYYSPARRWVRSHTCTHAHRHKHQTVQTGHGPGYHDMPSDKRFPMSKVVTASCNNRTHTGLSSCSRRWWNKPIKIIKSASSVINSTKNRLVTYKTSTQHVYFDATMLVAHSLFYKGITPFIVIVASTPWDMFITAASYAVKRPVNDKTLFHQQNAAQSTHSFIRFNSVYSDSVGRKSSAST